MRQPTTIIMGCLALAVSGGCNGRIDGSADDPAGPSGEPKPSVPARPGDRAPAGAANTPGAASPSMPLGKPVAGPPPPPGKCSIGPSPLRRLTSAEYSNTVRDLFGLSTGQARQLDVGRSLLADARIDGFSNNAASQHVTLPHLQQYLSTADALADEATRDLAKLVGCDPVSKGEAACAADFIKRFGKRAYRRPLTPVEESILSKVFDAGRAGVDFKSGITALVQAILLAPQFLYRPEILPAEMRSDRAVPLAGWEVATRLSYLFWGTMPDAELFAAAEAGKLQTKTELRAQAERLLASPRAVPAIAKFHEQWLDLDGMPGIEKDPKVFPLFTASVAARLTEETSQFVSHVFWQGGGKLTELLQAPYTFRNESLAKYYSDPGYVKNTAADAGTIAKVDTDPVIRAGLLTQGGFVAMLSKTDNTGAVERGKFLRERFLCGVIPPPPPGTNQVLPELPPPYTTRQRLANTEQNAACSVCHKLMNPLGLALENYDAAGRWRATENGLPIDTASQLTQTDVDGPFTGAAGLSAKLIASGQAQACVVKSWFQYGHGRSETDVDACTLGELKTSFATAGLSARELLVSLTQSDAFTYRTVAEGATP